MQPTARISRARAKVACAAGIGADLLRRKIEPEGHKMVVPKGLNACDVPADVLKTGRLRAGLSVVVAVDSRTAPAASK